MLFRVKVLVAKEQHQMLVEGVVNRRPGCIVEGPGQVGSEDFGADGIVEFDASGRISTANSGMPDSRQGEYVLASQFNQLSRGLPIPGACQSSSLAKDSRGDAFSETRDLLHAHLFSRSRSLKFNGLLFGKPTSHTALNGEMLLMAKLTFWGKSTLPLATATRSDSMSATTIPTTSPYSLSTGPLLFPCCSGAII